LSVDRLPEGERGRDLKQGQLVRSRIGHADCAPIVEDIMCISGFARSHAEKRQVRWNWGRTSRHEISADVESAGGRENGPERCYKINTRNRKTREKRVLSSRGDNSPAG
jgi:hypothetical protein